VERVLVGCDGLRVRWSESEAGHGCRGTEQKLRSRCGEGAQLSAKGVAKVNKSRFDQRDSGIWNLFPRDAFAAVLAATSI